MGRRAVVVAFEATWPLKGVNVSVLGVKGQATPFLGHVFIQQTHILCWAQKSSKKKKKSLGLSLPPRSHSPGCDSPAQSRVGSDKAGRGAAVDKPGVGWVRGGEEPDTDTETGPGGWTGSRKSF